ncbi:MAG: LolA-like outer membrane lipoprotein chaperone [Campylobacterota bacterium]|nr:LolA-like outer membrane lipoprotein chaperone [Campylobacterota bacterium]
MKHIIITILLGFNLFASLLEINSFKADFIQKITDDKNKVLTYEGSVIATNTKNALWSYNSPVQKLVYLNLDRVTIVEPEIEQVIIRYIKSNFNFFDMIKDAKKITEDKYITKFNDVDFTIITQNQKIKSIGYIDEFENKVNISFKNQEQNIIINENDFLPRYDVNFDVIRD